MSEALISDATRRHLEENRQRHVDELVELVSFPSISSDPDRGADVRACADWLVAHLLRIGLHSAELVETGAGGHPIVLGRWIGDPALPTVAVYGHYDVQPVEPRDAWSHDPFAAHVDGDLLRGRGASDNKGQLFANLVAVEALLAAEGALPCNLLVVLEGEEEWRSEGFTAALEADPERFRADLIICSDVTLADRGVPSLILGLRGFAALEMTLRGASVDVHSGLFGGVVPNPAIELGRLLAGLKDPETGRILVEGFYDGIIPPDAEEVESWRRLPVDVGEALAAVGLSVETGELDRTYQERTWARPTLDVNGLWSGFTGTGIKTIIPSTAHAKISCRLVPGMRPEPVIEAITRHLQARVPAGCELVFDWTLAGAPPLLVRPDSPGALAAREALEVAFGQPALLLRSGWSVPAAESLSRVVGVDCLLLGFGAPADNAHAPDEHYSLADFDRGVRTMVELWPRLARALGRDAA